MTTPTTGFRTVYVGTCGVCDAGGDWFAKAQRDDWFDTHWVNTGHDDPFTLDRPYVHEYRPGLRQAYYPGTCSVCGSGFPSTALVSQGPTGWCCFDCTPIAKERTA